MHPAFLFQSAENYALLPLKAELLKNENSVNSLVSTYWIKNYVALAEAQASSSKQEKYVKCSTFKSSKKPKNTNKVEEAKMLFNIKLIRTKLLFQIKRASDFRIVN